MDESKIVFHPKFLELFRQEELDDMMQKCDMYTEDDDGRIDLILIMGKNLNVQMDCGLGNETLIIENLDSTDEQNYTMPKSEFLEHLKRFESEETELIIIDDAE